MAVCIILGGHMLAAVHWQGHLDMGTKALVDAITAHLHSPEPWPTTVIESGLPPKWLMLPRVHSTASAMSQRPKLLGTAEWSQPALTSTMFSRRRASQCSACLLPRPNEPCQMGQWRTDIAMQIGLLITVNKEWKAI